MNRWRKSIVTIQASITNFDITKPYIKNNDVRDNLYECYGIIINIDLGYILSINNGIIQDSVLITAGLENGLTLELEIVSFSSNANLTLLKVTNRDIGKINSIPEKTSLNFLFGDSLTHDNYQEVNILGLDYCYSSYITRNKVLNNLEIIPGSPILNKDHKLIGICSGDKSYIPSRNFLNIYEHFLIDKIVPKIRLFCYSKSNKALLESITNLPDAFGLHVEYVSPKQVLDVLEKFDIVSMISFMDPFIPIDVSESEGLGITQNPALDIVGRDTSILKIKGSEITGVIDNNGMVSLYKGYHMKTLDNINSPKVVPDKLTFEEFSNLIPYGSQIKTRVLRENKFYELESIYHYKLDNLLESNYEINKFYPRFEEPNYIIIAGMCLMNLNLNIIDIFPELKKYSNYNERFRQYIVVVRIFNSSILKDGRFESGIILEQVNNIHVNTIKDIERALNKSKDIISFKFIDVTNSDNSEESYYDYKKNIIEEDLKIITQYNIKNYIFNDVTNNLIFQVV